MPDQITQTTPETQAPPQPASLAASAAQTLDDGVAALPAGGPLLLPTVSLLAAYEAAQSLARLNALQAEFNRDISIAFQEALRLSNAEVAKLTRENRGLRIELDHATCCDLCNLDLDTPSRLCDDCADRRRASEVMADRSEP